MNEVIHIPPMDSTTSSSTSNRVEMKWYMNDEEHANRQIHDQAAYFIFDHWHEYVSMR